MKKVSSLLLIMILAIGVLAACGPQEETTNNTEGTTDKGATENTQEDTQGNTEENKPEKLIIWEDKDKGAGLEDAIKSFEEEYGIKVEYKELDIYGLPKATETPIFIYNKAHMDKAPETFEELYQFSKDFTKGDQYGYLALWDNFYFAHAVIGGYGGYVFANDNGTLNPDDIGLNNEGALEGTKYIEKWYAEGLFREPLGIEIPSIV